MGLIKAALGSAGSTLADQWREYFYCDSMEPTVMVTKGKKRISGRSSNTKGSDNVISNGSVIAVNDGQCMMIVQQGAIVEFTAEPGEFTWDSSTEPTIFYGGLGKGIKQSWDTLKRRFTFGGDTAKDQRVYFFNLKELVGNKFGTPNPVPFRVVDTNIGLDMDVSIRCNGEYSYKISDPMLFYKNVCGNVAEDYTREKLDSQLRTEFMSALQPAFAEISAKGIRYSALPGHTLELSDAMNTALSAKWGQLRGLQIVSVGINSINASEEDEATIKELQKTAVFRNTNMAGAAMVGAQAEAMKAAAANPNGSMMGFMGMGMAQQVGGVSAAELFRMGANTTTPSPAAAPSSNDGGWRCSCGKEHNTGKFCSACGAPKPSDRWICPSCGKENSENFCSNCGAKRPEAPHSYRCSQCGWESKDPSNDSPKFCPQCGHRLGEQNIK